MSSGMRKANTSSLYLQPSPHININQINPANYANELCVAPEMKVGYDGWVVGDPGAVSGRITSPLLWAGPCCPHGFWGQFPWSCQGCSRGLELVCSSGSLRSSTCGSSTWSCVWWFQVFLLRGLWLTAEKCQLFCYKIRSGFYGAATTGILWPLLKFIIPIAACQLSLSCLCGCSQGF